MQVIVLLGTGGLNGGGYMASKYVVLAIYGAILVIHGLINSLPIQYMAWFGQLGAFWNAAGILLITNVELYLSMQQQKKKGLSKLQVVVVLASSLKKNYNT